MLATGAANDGEVLRTDSPEDSIPFLPRGVDDEFLEGDTNEPPRRTL